MDFDGTRNLFIEAENLEALKILQKAYAGSVKMIYIDPPYNTGSDSFIYPDKFSETREEYARRVGDKDDNCYLKRDGIFQGAWRKNSKDDGHYHSKWLSMMLPRLHLARTLLRDDGVIFISIDDNEQAQLKLLCDEVFGAENVEQYVWNLSDFEESSFTKTASNTVRFEHEYFIACYKSKKSLGRYKEYRLIDRDDLSNIDNDPRGDWFSGNLSRNGIKTTTGSKYFTITTPTGMTYTRNWTISKDEYEELLRDNRIYFSKNGDGVPRLKMFKTDASMSIQSSIFAGVKTSISGKNVIKSLFSEKEIFSFPKPIELLQRIATITTNSNDLILDFFSGSGTTAHAVMQLNAEDGGNRRYLCVQLSEETDEKSEARKAGFDTIAEIAKERIRRAGKQISGSLKDGQRVDTGFKVFKLSESSFKQWRQPENIADLGTTMEMFVNAVQDNAAPENMVYELMLRLGCKLTSAVEHKNGVYWVTDEDTGKRIALLLEAANQTLIDDVIAAAPAKVVALDKWFDGNDALKSNTVLQMKDAGIVFECV